MRAVPTLVLVTALVLVQGASAAAPTHILVTGPCLTRPVAISSWDENARLLASLVEAPRPPRGARALGNRLRMRLALFWGAPSSPAPTRPRDAAQHGVFYPAVGRRRAAFDLLVDGVRVPRVAPAPALAVLAWHGVPTRVARGSCR